MIQNIAVIGAGTMGNGIAHVFAQNNHTVHLVDTNQATLERAKNTITTNLDRLLAKGKITPLEKQNTLNNITLHTNLQQAVQTVDIAIEAVCEDIAIKQQIFRDLDVFCPEKTILASNTSSISITALAKVTKRPEKVIGMHFMNPVPIMPLVEIITGYNTHKQTVTQVQQLSKNLHKTSIISKDYPGFIANRILMPMINEAIETLYTGVAGVKEIDTVMQLGMAHPMGPLALADFIGLDICLSILEVLYTGFKNPKYAPCPLLVHMVTAGKLGVKTKEGFYNYHSDKKPNTVAAAFLV